MPRVLLLLILTLLPQAGGSELDKVLEKADALFEESRTLYEAAREKSAAQGFIDAGFRLEEARIKYLVLQEIGAPDKQKIAGDRLRALNQLTKLIHDGKVAVSGKAAGEPAPKPAETPQPPEPADPAKPEAKPPSDAGAPPSPALKPPADVRIRLTVPDVAHQKEAEKMVRDIFKEQYSKKAPADRQALARLLLEKTKDAAGEPAALWVMYRDAQENAVGTCDVATALASIDGVATFFDVDPLAMKNAALAAASKSAKTPDDFSALAVASLALLDDLVAADQYDVADKASAAALAHAKKSSDASLVQRVTARSRDVAEAKSRFLGMKGALETLAKNPADPAANNDMGQLLCFIKGNWDLGIRFLAKGSDATLKGLAEKELALPTQAAEQAAVGDGWWDLAEKEKSPLRKSQMLLHARSYYEAALPGLAALQKMRVEKRMEQLDGGTTGIVPLLRLIDPKVDAVLGAWQWEDRLLICPNLAFARLLIPYIPPEEYDLAIVLKRRAGGDGIIVGLAAGGTQFAAVIDSYVAPGGVTYLENLEGGGSLDKSPTVFHGHLIPEGGSGTIVCSVRKKGVGVTVNGRKLVSWEGDFKLLSPNPMWGVPDKRCLFIGGYTSALEISKMTLLPVTGQGKKLR